MPAPLLNRPTLQILQNYSTTNKNYRIYSKKSKPLSLSDNKQALAHLNVFGNFHSD